MLRVMATPFLVLDIETILDPQLPIAESSEAERLPAPPHHQVVVIGALWFDAAHLPRKIGVLGVGQNERGILEEFARVLNERTPILVTWNGRGFDLPVIAMRCLRYGISMPHYYGNRDVRYRFSPAGHLDVMDFVADFGAAKPSKLDVVAKLCGMPGKVGVDGKDVGPLMHAGKLDRVQAYCLCDVAQTAGVFLRVQLLRGVLSRDEYLAAMQGLLHMIDGDDRLGDVGRGLNRPRLLLEEESERVTVPTPSQPDSENPTPASD
jgi:predicted PolB exonuclease-like 3'-5' exonuclease